MAGQDEVVPEEPGEVAEQEGEAEVGVHRHPAAPQRRQPCRHTAVAICPSTRQVPIPGLFLFALHKVKNQPTTKQKEVLLFFCD